MAGARGVSQEAELESSKQTYDCHRCKDTGVVVLLLDLGEEVPIGDRRMWDEQFHQRAHVMKPCGCQERKRIEKLFRSSNITENFRKVGFKGFVIDGRPSCVREARDVALRYFQTFDSIRNTEHNSLTLLGQPGSGKTHLLMAVCNGLMRKGIPVQYFPWVEGFGDLKNHLDDLEERIDTMKRVDVLFIDDLFKGRRHPTDFQLEQLFNVVNFRYLNCLPMLVSSERDIDAICAIDEGMGRRIWERSYGHRVIMGLSPEERDAGMELNFSLCQSEKS